MKNIIKGAVILVGVIALTGCGVKYTTPDSAFNSNTSITNYDRIYLNEPELRVKIVLDESASAETIQFVDLEFVKKHLAEGMKAKKVNVVFTDSPSYVIRVHRLEKFDGNVKGYSGLGAGGAQAGYMTTGTVSGGIAGGVAMSALRVVFPPKSWVVEFSINKDDLEMTRYTHWNQAPKATSLNGVVSAASSEFFELSTPEK